MLLIHDHTATTVPRSLKTSKPESCFSKFIEEFPDLKKFSVTDGRSDRPNLEEESGNSSAKKVQHSKNPIVKSYS